VSSLSSKKSVTFYCFTPLVSLATFFIEISFVCYIFMKYKPTLFSKLCIALLISLGVFQLAEYAICTTEYKDIWVKIGYVSITLLPAIAIHIISTIVKRHTFLTTSAYTISGLLIAAIIFIPEVALSATCMTTYVDIQSHWLYAILHRSYYVGFILIGLYTLWYSMRKHIGDKKEEQFMIAAYAIFFIPSLVLFYFKVVVETALPSVMCGFAILTAFIFTLFLIPRYYQLQRKKKNKRS
jgi:hypothetical protein